MKYTEVYRVMAAMQKYGFTAPDMTVTEFIEDIVVPMATVLEEKVSLPINDGIHPSSYCCSACKADIKDYHTYCWHCGARFIKGINADGSYC